MSRSRVSSLAAFAALLAGCGGLAAPSASMHADGSSPAKSSPDTGAQAARDGSAHAKPDASVRADGAASRADAATGSDASHVDAARETGTGRDASTLDAGGDAPAPGLPDAGCIPTCSSSEACSDTCPGGFGLTFCCDMASHTCFEAEQYEPCPLHAGGCADGGCGTGEMCAAFISGPYFGPPACYALPAACTHDLTCSCLRAAGVCGDGGSALCADGGGASITCASL
jgi:hypothetical protein